MGRTATLAVFVLLVAGCGSDAPPATISGRLDGSAPDGATVGARSAWEALESARGELAAGAATADLDGDGRNELTRVRDASGKIVRDEIDLDGDGRSDLIWQHAVGHESFRADVDHDGVAEQAWDITIDPQRSGVASHVVVRDTDGDGKPDRRSSYTIDQATPTFEIRIEAIRADGTWELLRTLRASRDQEQAARRSALRFETDANHVGRCNDDQQSRVRDAYRDALDRGLPCLASRAPGVAAQLRFVLARAELTVECHRALSSVNPDTGEVEYACASAPGAYWGAGIEGMTLTLKIADIFWDETMCAEPSGTMFHELLHHALGDHVDIPAEDPVYGCEALCFGCPPSLRAGSSCDIPTQEDAAPQCRRAEPRTRSPDGDGLCFLGEWVTGTWKVPEMASRGGDGIRLTLRADGTGHADFDEMQTVVMTRTDVGGAFETSAYYRGEGGVTWSAAQGLLTIVYDDPTAFQMNTTSKLDGVTLFESMGTFADALVEAPFSSAMYQCKAPGWYIVSAAPDGSTFEMPFVLP